jgi:transcriptional regulator with XRE-family HTH domain
MNTLEIIGQRLRQARETAGYTPEYVAQKLGITKDDLLLFESGRQNPPLSLLRKLAKFYGVFVSYFYGIEKPEGTAFTLLLDKAKELSLPPETISQIHRFIFLCMEIVKLRQKLGIPKPEIPYYTLNQESIDEQAKEVAEAERARLGLGDSVVPNLGELLEDFVFSLKYVGILIGDKLVLVRFIGINQYERREVFIINHCRGEFLT